MGTDAKHVTALHLQGRQEFGDGFLRISRVAIVNEYSDGTRSAPFHAEFLGRPKGLDAVVVVVWRQPVAGGMPEVLLREGIRPGLTFGRQGVPLAVADNITYTRFAEIVAGIVEPHDVGLAGLANRVCAEVHEEAGYRVAPHAVAWLGEPAFPSPGVLPEKYYYAAVNIDSQAVHEPPPGDGSPFEEGAVTYWLPLDEAMARCERGEIADAKSELGFFRFAAWAKRTAIF